MATVANIICPEIMSKSENISLQRTTVVCHTEAISQDLTNQLRVNIKSFHWIWILNIPMYCITQMFFGSVWEVLKRVRHINGIIMFPETKDTS